MITSLTELINTLYGCRTTSIQNNLLSTIGTTVGMFFNNNPKRLAGQIVNLSANIMYIAPKNTVSSSYGIYLAPNGGTYTILYNESFDLVSFEWWVVSTAAASAIYTLEVVIY